MKPFKGKSVSLEEVESRFEVSVSSCGIKSSLNYYVCGFLFLFQDLKEQDPVTQVIQATLLPFIREKKEESHQKETVVFHV